jgi:hypothetical protein
VPAAHQRAAGDVRRTVTSPTLAAAHERADELFAKHGSVFGPDLTRYRGHVHRVIGLVGLQQQIPADAVHAFGTAAFFHDAAIWFDGTLDYLEPSASRAVAELGGAEHPQAGLVSALITEHHRLRTARHPDPLVEAMRRADLTDVCAGLIPVPGAGRKQYRQLVRKYPLVGFHPMMLRAVGRNARAHPLRPAPFLKF